MNEIFLLVINIVSFLCGVISFIWAMIHLRRWLTKRRIRNQEHELQQSKPQSIRGRDEEEGGGGGGGAEAGRANGGENEEDLGK